MSRPLSPRTAAKIEAATRAQQRAMVPHHQAWVAANAGSGKTHVLTGRILRLLLGGAKPKSLVALTYTRAAAAEMSARLLNDMRLWMRLEDRALWEALQSRFGFEKRDEALLRRARRLFADVIETPEGLAIQTIHSFCQRLLQRFPLEAGIAPNFELLDEAAAQEIYHRVQRRLFARPADYGLSKALETITAVLSEQAFAELLAALTRARGHIKRWIADTRYPARLAQALELPDSEPEPERAWLRLAQDPIWESPTFIQFLDYMQREKSGTKASAALTRYRAIAPAAVDEAAVQALYSAIKTKRLKFAQETFADTRNALVTRLEAAFDEAKARELLGLNLAIAQLARQVLHQYDAQKRVGAYLDYDDLIETSARLLEDPSRSAWVQFKLDTRIDHLLIDEAQDTSPAQWRLIGHLAQDLLATREEAKDKPRSLCVVGDLKQSIYSFQGARPEYFSKMHDRIAELRQGGSADEALQRIPLTVSFRSDALILDAVDAVFRRDDCLPGLITEGDAWHEHEALDPEPQGFVELVAPLTLSGDSVELSADKPYRDYPLGLTAKARYGAAVAARIALLLREQNGKLTPDDIMVLLRKRDRPFMDALTRALRGYGIATSGRDRLIVNESLAAQDLLALAQVALLPEDDYSLACLLKSPLVGLSEEALFDLAYNRGQASLWQALKSRAAEKDSWRVAAAFVAEALRQADRLPPLDFFAHMLAQNGARRALIARLGDEGEDALRAFLSSVLAFEQRKTASLSALLETLRQQQQTLNRDIDKTRGAVRIMTIHKAKGLEAPVVVLPELGSRTSNRGRYLEITPNLGIYTPSTGWARGASQTLWAQRDQQEQEEANRLLYVALTRAEKGLILFSTDKIAQQETSWMARIQAAWEAGLPPAPERLHLTPKGAAGEADIEVTRWGQLTLEKRGAVQPKTAIELPPWYDRAPPDEGLPAKRITPSRANALVGETLEAAAGAAAELAADPRTRTAALERGTTLHQLLQHLPDLAPEQRQEAAQKLLLARGYKADEVEAYRLEVLKVLDAYPELFGKESRSEVAVAGQIDGLPAVGKIDRLVVREAQVHIIDYKTNRRPPEVTPESYRQQLSDYKRLVSPLYPEKQVVTWLLWTAALRLERVPS